MPDRETPRRPEEIPAEDAPARRAAERAADGRDDRVVEQAGGFEKAGEDAGGEPADDRSD